MKHILEDLNRLKLMSTIYKKNYFFNELKEKLELTDGNLMSHIKLLEKEELIQTQKTKVANRLKTEIGITQKGVNILEEYLEFMYKLIKQTLN